MGLDEVRVGVDLVAVPDVAEAVRRFGDGYLGRVYTVHERACAAGSPEASAASLAARFAAKEATIKVLEPGPDGPVPAWRDIEVLRLGTGACRLRLHGTAAYLAARAGIARTAVSLSHEGPAACAVVVASLDNAAACHEEWPDCHGERRAQDWLAGRPDQGQQGERPMDEEIRTILAEHGRLPVDVSTIGEHDDLYQVGLTSHACVKVMLALEERFEVEFPPAMLRKRTFASLGSIREALSTLAAASA